jgi:hypothetical protein
MGRPWQESPTENGRVERVSPEGGCRTTVPAVTGGSRDPTPVRHYPVHASRLFHVPSTHSGFSKHQLPRFRLFTNLNGL